MINMDDVYYQCRKCKKFKTSKCPNSDKCFVTSDKPYFEKKEDLSKKERFINWLKEVLAYLFGY